MKKQFRMIDLILAVICVIFVAEAAAPVASIGNSQYFWWAFMLIFFLLPYGLIAAELGTTFESDGGLYDWVKDAFGKKWGTRVSWYYWINFPLWMASLAVMTPEMLGYVFGTELSLMPTIAIELVFIWICVYSSFYPAADSTWILNGAALLKMILAILVGVLGVAVAIKHGVANPITVEIWKTRQGRSPRQLLLADWLLLQFTFLLLLVSGLPYQRMKSVPVRV